MLQLVYREGKQVASGQLALQRCTHLWNTRIFGMLFTPKWLLIDHLQQHNHNRYIYIMR